MSVLLAVLLGVVPVHTAETVPAGTTAVSLACGFALLRIGVPTVPLVPVVSGDAEVAHGLADGLDLRLRYTTHLGVVHRAGAELRARIARAGRWSLAARLYPSTQFVGSVANAARPELEYGGDVSTLAGLVVTYRAGAWAFTAEAGATVQWLVYEHAVGRTEFDGVPYLAWYDTALAVEWALGDGAALTARLEVAVPRGSDDPFALGGVFPRLLVGGSFVP